MSANLPASENDVMSPWTSDTRARTSGGSAASLRRQTSSISSERSSPVMVAPTRAEGMSTRPVPQPSSSGTARDACELDIERDVVCAQAAVDDVV